jgi:hypothetical protein
MDLAEFVSDMLALEPVTGKRISNYDIAVEFLDRTADPELTEAEFMVLAEGLEAQVAYYTERDS